MNKATRIVTSARVNNHRLQFNYLNPSSDFRRSLKEVNDYELNALMFLAFNTPGGICSILKTPFALLQDQLNKPVYSIYSIPKKRGGQREIAAPSDTLKSIQTRLNYYLQAYYLCIKPAEAHGFVLNPNKAGAYCNIVENAKSHINKKQVLNIDLKDFFPNISAKRVLDLFSSEYFNFNEQVATALALLTTYEGKLPIGAPTSPVISNFICLQLDRELKSYCLANSFAFSRYADDLTFSADVPITAEHIQEITSLIRKNNFEVNKKKTRLKSSNRKQTVTGLTVNEKVNVDRKLLKKIRAMLHDFTTNGLDAATSKHFKLKSEVDSKSRSKFISRLEGYINFVGQVRGLQDRIYLRHKASFVSLMK